jgi:hypothetical protein
MSHAWKARFVAKGCSQRVGLDYTETFSLAIRMASLRLFLAIAVARELELCQLDIDTAFLYAPIKEDVYIRQPLGFFDGTSKVCHLEETKHISMKWHFLKDHVEQGPMKLRDLPADQMVADVITKPLP